MELSFLARFLVVLGLLVSRQRVPLYYTKPLFQFGFFPLIIVIIIFLIIIIILFLKIKKQILHIFIIISQNKHISIQQYIL